VEISVLRNGRRIAVAAAIALAAALVLAACGGSSGGGGGGGGNNTNYGYQLPQSAVSPSASPVAVASPPAVMQVAAPAQAPAPPPAPVYPRAPMSFPLTPVQGVTGSVTIVVTSASSFTVSVSANGMAPGSTHAVHLHFGNCPSAGTHITALSSVTAGPSGSGSSSTTVRLAYHGDGRFVIVYAGPNPGPLAACAQLSGS
jgi:hypothetical protein